MMRTASRSCPRGSRSLVLALLICAPSSALAADCFDGQRIGLFTERHYAELDRPWRDKTNDPKIDNRAKTALRSLRADITLVRADALETALAQARGNDLPVLAFLDVEASSSKIEMQTMVNIETALRLQFLKSGDGSVLGESSDFDEVKGLDIEQALPQLVEVSSIATMAKEAGRKACKTGWSAAPLVAEKPPASTKGSETGGGANPRLVRDVQYALNDLGYDVGTPDGITGSVTVDAIRRAEDDFRLPSSGKPTRGLLAKLHEQLITDTQLLLQDLGRIKGGASGTSNRETELAIKAVEREQGFPVDGKPDGQVISVLEAAFFSDRPSPTGTSSDDDQTLRFEIEKLLVALDYLERPPSSEESFDGTEAIRRAELEYGLDPDGRPDISLFRKLQSAQRGS